MNKRKSFIVCSILCFTFSLMMFECADKVTNESTVYIGTFEKSASPKVDLREMYVRAIEDYIRLVDSKYHIRFDTLMFGKHSQRQPGDFPDIILPESIGNVHIALVSPEQGREKKDTQAYINLFGDVHPTSANFIFVTFLNGFSHSFDCFTEYEYSTDKREFELMDSSFKEFDTQDIEEAKN